MKSLYDLSDEVEVRFYLGIEIKRMLSEKAILISQVGYIRNILDGFGTANCKAAPTSMTVGERLDLKAQLI